MIHTDDAMLEIRQLLGQLGIRFDTDQCTDEEAVFTADTPWGTIPVSFNAKTQLYEFKSPAGGRVSYQNVNNFKDDFREMCKTVISTLQYVDKLIADFASTIGLVVNYKNMPDANTVVYSVVSHPEFEVFVNKQAGTDYIVRWQEYNADKSKARTKAEYHYEFDENGALSVVPTISSYIHELYSRYENSDRVNIKRSAVNTFEVEIEGTSFTYSVDFEYRQIVNTVTMVNGVETELRIEDMDDPYSLELLSMRCAEWYADHNGIDLDTVNEVYQEEKEVQAGLNEIDTDLIEETLAEEAKEVVVEESAESDGVDLMGDGVTAEMLAQNEAMRQPVENIASAVEAVSGTKLSGLDVEPEADFEADIEAEEAQAEYEEAEEAEELEETVDTSADLEPAEEQIGEPASEHVEDVKIHEESTEPAPEPVEEVIGSEESGSEPAEENIEPEDSESSEEEVSVDLEPVEEQISESVEESDSFSVNVKVVRIGGRPLCLQFFVSGKFYNIGVEKAAEMGIPLGAIAESTTMATKRGVSMSEDERQAKVFAIDVTDDAEKCAWLYSLLFE